MDVARVLDGLESARRVYELLLERARRTTARLAEDYVAAGQLATSLEVAVVGPA